MSGPVHPQVRTVIVMLAVPAGWVMLSPEEITAKLQRDPEVLRFLGAEIHRMLQSPDILDAGVVGEKMVQRAAEAQRQCRGVAYAGEGNYTRCKLNMHHLGECHA